MISKSIIKLIKSLALKKYRNQENLFIAEGDKNVLEVLKSTYSVKILIGTKIFISANKHLVDKVDKIITSEPKEIKTASLLKTPQNCIAICKIPEEQNVPEKINELSLFLDGIQDPGNFGTIIRTCDWFGIDNIFCSQNTVDLYNPKVIQATMGSFCRVNVSYTEAGKIEELARNSKIPVYGTFLTGTNIYKESLQKPALIIVGNEGNGISNTAEKMVDKRLRIPDFRTQGERAESLNVAIATAIICSEFRR